MTQEELLNEKTILKERIETLLESFYIATGVTVSGQFCFRQINVKESINDTCYCVGDGVEVEVIINSMKI